MRGLVKIGLAAITCALLTGCGGSRTAPADNWVDLVHPDVLAKANLEYYWRMDVHLKPGEAIDRLYQLDEKLYCLTTQNRLIATDAARGVPQWSRRVAKPGRMVFRPAHADDVFLSEKVSGVAEILAPEKIAGSKSFNVVVINSLSYVLVMDRADGKVLRKIVFDFAANTGGDCDGVNFCVGATDGTYHAFLLQEAVPTWTRSTGDILTAPLECFGGRLYVGSTDGAFYATQTGRKGSLLWNQKTDGPITAAFCVDRRGAFVPSEDNRLYAYDAISGRLLWDPVVCQGPLRDPVQVGENTVFQFARRDTFYAIDLATGRVRWKMPAARKVLAVMNGNVYLLDQRRNLLVVDEMLGEVEMSLPMLGYDRFVSSTGAKAIYAATRGGTVVCIRLRSAGYLTLEKMAEEDEE